jgi:hypothetical protein
MRVLNVDDINLFLFLSEFEVKGMMDIQQLFTTEGQLLIEAPSVPTDTSGLYIDGGPLFCLLFCGSKKVRKTIINFNYDSMVSVKR